MQDKTKEYDNPYLRNKDYLEYCDKLVNEAITENETFKHKNTDHDELFDMNDMDNSHDMDINHPLENDIEMLYDDIFNF